MGVKGNVAPATSLSTYLQDLLPEVLLPFLAGLPLADPPQYDLHLPSIFMRYTKAYFFSSLLCLFVDGAAARGSVWDSAPVQHLRGLTTSASLTIDHVDDTSDPTTTQNPKLNLSATSTPSPPAISKSRVVSTEVYVLSFLHPLKLN